jgi:hypothetical protein
MSCLTIADPDIFYIASVHGWNQYGLAAWTGISGDKFYKFDRGGPEFLKMTPEWIKENIQIGPLGAVYPDYMFIPEGDTPTLLYLIQNGLGDPEHPEWGSWGGRYAPSSEGGRNQHYGDVADTVIGQDGQEHVSNQATVWRWRDAFQDDFAARMRWTVSERYEQANHAPMVSVNGSGFSSEAVHITAEAGTRVELDASESYDPDSGDKLTFTWTQYKEPTATQWQVAFEVAPLVITDLSSDPAVPNRKIAVDLPSPGRCCMSPTTRQPVAEGQSLHLILQVSDDGAPRMTTYKRIVIHCTNAALSSKLGEGERDPMEDFKEAIEKMRRV